MRESRYLGTGTRSEHIIVASAWWLLHFLKECVIKVKCEVYVQVDKYDLIKIEYKYIDQTLTFYVVHFTKNVIIKLHYVICIDILPIIKTLTYGMMCAANTYLGT
jgi:hypothetical protein